MEYRKQGHCVYGMEYHIVLTTKYRIIKSYAGRSIREKFPFLNDLYWGDDGI